MNIFEKTAQDVAPHLWVSKVIDIDFDKLKDMGIKGIILDLDNTILPWKDYNVPPSSLEWVNRGKSQGFKFIILSNTIHTKRLAHIGSALGCEYIHPAFKPNPKNYLKACNVLGLEKEETACVGDQLFTDMKGGRRAGVFCILVEPMDKKEFAGTKISRFFERKVKKYIKYIH